jgi:hypothetical protein
VDGRLAVGGVLFLYDMYLTERKWKAIPHTHTQANNFVKQAGDEEREKGKVRTKKQTVHTQQANSFD